jgi:hypothetical protein
MDAMATKTTELGGKIQDTSGKTINFNKNLKTTTFDSKALGQAMMGAGAAVGGLAAIFSAAGWEEGAEAMSKLSMVIFGLGAVFSFIVPLMEKGAMKLVAAGLSV